MIRAALFLCLNFLVLSPEKPVEQLYQEIHAADDKTVVVLTTEAVKTAALEELYSEEETWMTLPDRESGISFYAGLFKQIKLEDLYEKLDLQPLIAMAGIHAFKIPGHHLQPVFSKKCSYQPVASFIPSQGEIKKADLVVFSFDRPLQLYAFLESVERYVTGLGEIAVVYRTSNSDYEAGYEKVQRRFSNAKFLHEADDFKSLFLKAAFETASPYLLMAVDDIVVKSEVDLAVCIQQMEQTEAFGFYLRLGSHIDYCYMTDTAQKVPPAWKLAGGVSAWQFKQAEADWSYACSVDMTLYRKAEIEGRLRKLEYHNPNLLESAWALKAPRRGIGLCFAESKVVNIPLNMVNESNLWSNRHFNSYSSQQLLEKFQAGLKIDISPLHHIVNRSPHIDFEVSFIPERQP